MLLALQRNKALDLMNPHVLDYLDKPQALGNLVMPIKYWAWNYAITNPKQEKQKKKTQFYNKNNPLKPWQTNGGLTLEKKKKYKHVLVK